MYSLTRNMKSAFIRFGILIGISLIIVGCASRGPKFERSPSASLQSISVATNHRAVTPASRINPEKRGGWERRHEQLNERAAQGGYDLLFIGDSITHFWETFGENVWNEYYADRNALNIGISGDQTQHALWRLENGNLKKVYPKVAVLMIGTNNYASSSPAEIADGIVAIVQKLNHARPDMKILVLGIFPRADVAQEKQDNLKAVNRMVSKIADGDRIHYLDISDAFLDEQGKLTKNVMPDLLHPQEYGYTLWAEAMESKLQELLGE